MNQKKEKYRAFSAAEPGVSLFMKGWWLDSVCGADHWDVCLVESNNEIVAALPYQLRKQLGFTMLNMPKLSSGWGPWIKYPTDQKYSSRLSYEHQLINKLIDQLPAFDYFNQRFSYKAINCQAFYWKNFSLTLRYNYILPDLTNLESILGGFNSNIRREIKKAEKIVKVIEGTEIDQFYAINKKTFERNNLQIPYSNQLLKTIDQVCIEKGCRKIFLAVDDTNTIHAALYLVWDAKTAYYLMGGMDPKYKSGAFSLLMWSAIQKAAAMNLSFDFEGSMIESVERFFREFGATQVPYTQVQKTNSYLLKLATALKPK